MRLNEYLRQGEVWKPKDRDPVRIADMDDTWRYNAVRFMQRHAGSLAMKYQAAALNAMWVGADFDGHWFDEDQAPTARPERWIKTTKLYRTLLATLPTGDALAALAERARHWSTCPTRQSTELTCSCGAGPAPRIDTELWVRGFLGLDRQPDPEPLVTPTPAPVADPPARCTAGGDCPVHPALQAIHNPDVDLSDRNIDSSTGRPWGVDEDGFDHQEPHGPNDWCPFNSCAGCGGYHCGWYCSANDEGADQ